MSRRNKIVILAISAALIGILAATQSIFNKEDKRIQKEIAKQLAIAQKIETKKIVNGHQTEYEADAIHRLKEGIAKLQEQRENTKRLQTRIESLLKELQHKSIDIETIKITIEDISKKREEFQKYYNVLDILHSLGKPQQEIFGKGFWGGFPSRFKLTAKEKIEYEALKKRVFQGMSKSEITLFLMKTGLTPWNNEHESASAFASDRVLELMAQQKEWIAKFKEEDVQYQTVNRDVLNAINSSKEVQELLADQVERLKAITKALAEREAEYADLENDIVEHSASIGAFY